MGISQFGGQIETENIALCGKGTPQGRKSTTPAFISIWSHSLNPNELREIKVRFWADISEISKTHSGIYLILMAKFRH